MTNHDISVLNKRFKNTRCEGDQTHGECYLYGTLIASWTKYSITIMPLKRQHWTQTTLRRINQLLEICGLPSRLHQHTNSRGATGLYWSHRTKDRWLENTPAFFSFSGEEPKDVQLPPRYYIRAKLDTDTVKGLTQDA